MNQELKSAITQFSNCIVILHGNPSLITVNTKFSFEMEILLGEHKEPLTLRLEQQFLTDALEGTGFTELSNQYYQIKEAVKKYSIDKLLDNGL